MFVPTCPGFGEADLLTDRSMLAGLITCKTTCAVCIKAPALPVILIVLFPSGVLALVVIVKVDVFEEASVMLIVAGSKIALAPAGRPLAARFTTPVKPASGVTVTEYVVLPPGTDEREEGVAITEKSAVAEAGEEATKVK